jgi:hypothetical protein
MVEIHSPQSIPLRFSIANVRFRRKSIDDPKSPPPDPYPIKARDSLFTRYNPYANSLEESFEIEINHGVVIRELAARPQFAGRIPSKRRRLLELVEHLHNPGIPAAMEQLRDASHYIKVISQTIHRIQSASHTESRHSVSDNVEECPQCTHAL